MTRKLRIKIFMGLLIAVVFGLSSQATAQTQRVKTAFRSDAATQQPLYTEYRGVRLGMTAEEARAKLGSTVLKADDQDFYAFSENESAQIVYDSARKVVTISVDYLGGIGAPDYKAVLGGNLTDTADGSVYRLVRYESLGLWVSYNRTAGPAATVSVTIQKLVAGSALK